MPDPALQTRDTLAAVAGEDVGNVDELRGEVAQDVDVACGSGEGEDLRGRGDEGEGLVVQSCELGGLGGFGGRGVQARGEGGEFGAGGYGGGGGGGVG